MTNNPSDPAPIPSDRPVLGRDLETLQQRLACPTMRLCALLGVSLSTWTEWKNQPEQPLPSPAALLVRLYDRFPFLLLPDPTPEALRQALMQREGRPMTLVELSLLLGRECTAGYRWKTRSPPSATVVSLIESLLRLLETEESFEEYRRLVEAEARARGIVDIWAQQTWKIRMDESKGD